MGLGIRKVAELFQTAHHIGFAHCSNMVALYQFAATLDFDLTIDRHLSILNQQLGFAARLSHAHPFEKLIQLDRALGG